jgi:hypothetical protein
MRHLILCVVLAGLLISAWAEEGDSGYCFGTESSSETSAEYVDCPSGAKNRPVYDAVESGVLPDPNDPTSTSPYMTPTERDLRFEEAEQSARPELDWSGDVLVSAGPVGSGQDFDYDLNTGNLYAVYDTDHFMHDSLLIYVSEDHGETWELYDICVNNDGGICNPKIRIVEDSDGESWMLVMGIWEERMAPDPLWSARQKLSGGSRFWEQIADDVCFADLDADVDEDPNWAYVTYQPAGTTDVWAARNRLNGWGWIDNVMLFYNTIKQPEPAIAAGADGTVAVVFADERFAEHDEFRLKRSSDFGETWSNSQNVSNSGSHVMSHPDIAFSNGATQIGWITSTYFISYYSDYNFGYYLSEDSGISWDYIGIFYTDNVDDAHHQLDGSIRCSKTSGSVSLCYKEYPGGALRFTWASIFDPDDFDNEETINDYYAPVDITPCAGWNGNSFSSVLYAGSPGYGLYYDWYSNGAFARNQNTLSSSGIETEVSSLVTGISNYPNPFSSSTEIAFQLSEAAPVSISIYDVSGRTVSTIVDGIGYQEGSHSLLWEGTDTSGAQVPAGVYICRITAGSNAETSRIVVAR